MNRIAGRAGIAWVLILVLLAGFGFFLFEFTMESEDWVMFSGSPHIYNGSNIGCGVITDRDGILLLDTRDGRTYGSDPVLRASTVHWVGDRYGSIYAPALSHHAAKIAGFDLLNGIYSYGNTGGVAELTLIAKAQATALEALGNYKGTVGVYNYKTGELLCAVTTPTYDPDNLPDIKGDTTGAYEGVYMNRFTQSVYIPGSIFKIVTLAAALETIPDIQEQTFSCTGTYKIGADEIVCEKVHYTQNLKKAFANSCNCAFAKIALQLGAETLDRYAAQFGITQSVEFDGIRTATGNFTVLNTAQVSVAWSAIGQYKDQINPCRFMTFVGAVAAGGKGAQPHLVSRITSGGQETYAAQTQAGDRILSDNTAKILQEYMRNNVEVMYGANNFPGLTVCAKTGTAQVDGNEKPNAMIAGFVADEEYPLAFIVAVEDAGAGGKVCVPILSKVLAACKESMDS